MNQLQRIGLTGMTILLLIGFWAGLWYQGQKKGGTVVLAAAGVETAEGISGQPAAPEETGIAGQAAEGEAVKEEGVGKARSSKAAEVTLNDSEAVKNSELADEEDMAVHVVGKVVAPGLFFLPPGSRIYDAVMLAEPEKDADLGRLNLALPLEDGMQIRVPIIGKPSAWDDALIVRADDNYQLGQERGQSQWDSKEKININKAAAAELETLPGIGPAYSQRIIQYREEKGGFRTAEDLLKVKGIGRAKMEELKDLICCS